MYKKFIISLYNTISNRAKNLRPIFLFILFIFFFHISFAQYYTNGVDNSNIKWRQIKTKEFKIIYPDFYETKAHEFASILNYIQPQVSKSLKTNPPYTPFILHTNTAYSNGMSIWAPKRIELWTSNPVNSEYAFDWMGHLAIHEWRHTSQIYALNKGFTKFFTTLFGEHILGGVTGLYLPYWFLEGDAVVAETSMSPSARGHSAEFKMYLKAQILDNKKYSFDKAKQGSMKDFVADRYIFGYHMVSYGRYRYGKDIWGEMLNTLGKDLWRLRNLSKGDSIKVNQEKLYNDMYDYLHKEWAREDSLYNSIQKSYTPNKISKENKRYTNYYYPQTKKGNKVFTIKTDNFSRKKLISLSNKKEKKIIEANNFMDNYFFTQDSMIVWSEYRDNHRWENESYSDVFEYNLNNKKYNRITKKKRIYSPIYKPKDNGFILAIEEDSINNQSIIIIDKRENKIERINIFGEYSSLSSPIWNTKGDRIYYIKNGFRGKSIEEYNLEDKSFREIIPKSYKNIINLRFHNDRLYFLGSYDNTYQIYSVDSNSNILRHTHSRLSVLDHNYIGDSILISDYSSKGSELFMIPNLVIDTLRNISETMFLAKVITNQEGFVLDKDSIKDIAWVSKPYSKLKNLFLFHSWAPLYINSYSQDFGYGLSIFSQNLLSSSILETGLKYNNSNNKTSFFLNYNYSGLYPIININMDYGDRYNYFFDPLGKIVNSHWREMNLKTKITLPYSSRNNRWNRYFANSIEHNLIDINPIGAYPNNILSLNTIGFESKGQILRPMAKNDIRPRFGIFYNLTLSTSFEKRELLLSSYSLTAFLPGFLKNNSIEISLSNQRNSIDIYNFSNTIPLTRGYQWYSIERFTGLRTNYHLPILYPDLAIGRVFYIQRLMLTAFYDIGKYNSTYLSSFGGDINFRLNFLRIEQPLNIGYRLGYAIEGKYFFGNIIFSISI
ncbi:MAG: hypothetical protein RBR79_01635 [Bacteroidales bacterium]|jgi:hypothetical protein|nr:hypothetical protein [Bacteroidales bacterium]